jgi:hypothetical protein
VTPFSSTDLKRWIEENKHLFQPPYKIEPGARALPGIHRDDPAHGPDAG